MDPRTPPALLVLLLLAATPLSAQTADALETTTYYLTGLTGEGVDDASDLTLASSLASTASSVTLTPLTGGIGLPVDPGVGSDRQTWHTVEPWSEDMELTSDATVSLWFQGLGDVTVELLDVHPDGTERTLGEERRNINRQGQGPQEETFRLPALGQIMEEHHGLRLRIAIDSLTSAVTLHYDSVQAPAALRFTHSPLDSDDDGVSDREERAMGTDPLDPKDPDDRIQDTDRDGITDDQENSLGTDPASPDSDGDGWSDGAERRLGTDPLDATSRPLDTDLDGLSDAWERRHFDGLQAGPLDDPDDDQLTNLQEQQHGTDPTDADTDDDGTDDGKEVAQGRDPLGALHADLPEPRLIEPVAGILLAIATAGLATVGLLRRHAL